MLPGPINQAAENFMRFFMQGQRLEQQERAQELRERQQDLREQAFEQEMAEVQAQTMMNQAQLQANPQLQQNPAVGNVLSQMANAQSPAGASQALGPAINQAVITQATEAARASMGEDVEAPSAGQFEQAAQATGVPGETRSAVRRATSPTEMEAMEDRLAAIQAVPAIRLADRLADPEDDLTLEDLARDSDPTTLMAAGQLGLDQELRAMREDFRQDIASQRDFRESIQKSAVDQAESLLDETNLEGEIPLGPVVRGIRDGFGALPEEQQELVAPLRQQLRQSRLKQQAAMVSEIEDTPVQQMLSTLANTALENGDQERALEFYNQKRDIAGRQTGLSGEDLPYPEISEEEAGGVSGFLQSLGIGDPELTVDLPTTDGEFTQDELQDVSNFIITEHDGDVQAAFRAMQQRVRDAGGVEEIPEDARRTFEAVRFLRDSLRSNGNSE